MNTTHDSNRPLTEADRTSETRFGPRPVPKGHHSPQSRRTIASGRMSPDGRSSYPTPGLGAKIAVWGGVALGVAGGTAAAVYAVRAIADAISSDPQPDRSRRYSAPTFAQMEPEDREAMRRRVRAQDREDRQEIARLRADAAQQRSAGSSAPDARRSAKPAKSSKGNFVDDLIEKSDKLSRSLEGLAKSLSVAVVGFRSVAQQATEIVSEFASSAEHLRAALRGEDPEAGKTARNDGRSDRTHNL